MDWATIGSIVGVTVALVGVAATAIKQAEDRGRQQQRQEELEQDVRGAFEKIRSVEGKVVDRIETVLAGAEQRARELEDRQNKQEADAAEIRATLKSVDHKVDYTNTKLDELIRFHTRTGGHD